MAAQEKITAKYVRANSEQAKSTKKRTIFLSLCGIFRVRRYLYLKTYVLSHKNYEIKVPHTQWIAKTVFESN